MLAALKQQANDSTISRIYSIPAAVTVLADKHNISSRLNRGSRAIHLISAMFYPAAGVRA